MLIQPAAAVVLIQGAIGAKIYAADINNGSDSTAVLASAAQNTANFIIASIAILSVFYIAWSAVLYITAGEDEGQVEKSRSIIAYALIGLFIAAAAYAIELFTLAALAAWQIL